MYGDPLLDVVGAIVMADMFTDVSAREQADLLAYTRDRAGPALDRVFESYWVFYALSYAMGQALLPWCARRLRRVASEVGDSVH